MARRMRAEAARLALAMLAPLAAGLAAASLLALSPAGRAGDFWKTKPPAEWTQEEAVEVLTSSPWAQRIRLPQWSGRMLAVFSDGTKAVSRETFDGPQRIFSETPEREEMETVQAVYEVRWSSAVAVQRALERLQALSPVVRELQAPPPELPADFYVVTARVVEPPAESAMEALGRPTLLDESTGRPVRDTPPKVADIFAGLSEEELRARTELNVMGKLRLKPERVLRRGTGAGEGISFFFPRRQEGRETLPAGTAWAEFVFESAKAEKLKARFKLKEMQAGGRPDY